MIGNSDSMVLWALSLKNDMAALLMNALIRVMPAKQLSQVPTAQIARQPHFLGQQFVPHEVETNASRSWLIKEIS